MVKRSYWFNATSRTSLPKGLIGKNVVIGQEKNVSFVRGLYTALITYTTNLHVCNVEIFIMPLLKEQLDKSLKQSDFLVFLLEGIISTKYFCPVKK